MSNEKDIRTTYPSNPHPRMALYTSRHYRAGPDDTNIPVSASGDRNRSGRVCPRRYHRIPYMGLSPTYPLLTPRRIYGGEPCST